MVDVPSSAYDYYAGLNEPLLNAVPSESTVIVEVGCANGRLGAALKLDRPDRTVIGLERDNQAAAIASKNLDKVIIIDVDIEMPTIERSSVDCVVFGDVLEHLLDPLPLLRAARVWLKPDGVIVCSIPNIAHTSVLRQIFRGDFQYQAAGILDRTHLRFYTYATIMKMMLETGFAPSFSDVIELRDDAVVAAAGPLLDAFEVGESQALRHLNAYQYIVTATPLPFMDDVVDFQDQSPISFVACVNDTDQLKSNLLASPCLGPGTPHEVLLYEGMGSAAEGLNRGLREAKNETIVFVHQDVFLPSWWPAQLALQWSKAENSGGRIDVAGAFGVRYREGGRTHVGRVIDRDRMLAMDIELPADVDGLDELLIVVKKQTPLRFEPAVGWHLYGTDLALQAHVAGLRTVVLDLPCHHNSLLKEFGGAYRYSESVLARKWPTELPIVTNSSTIDQDPLAADFSAKLEEQRQTTARELEEQRKTITRELEEQRQKAVLLEKKLAKRNARIAAMEASRSWRLNRLLNRFRNKISG